MFNSVPDTKKRAGSPSLRPGVRSRLETHSLLVTPPSSEALPPFNVVGTQTEEDIFFIHDNGSDSGVKRYVKGSQSEASGPDIQM